MQRTRNRLALTRRAATSLMIGGVTLGAWRANAAEAIEQKSVEIGGVRDPQLGVQLAIAEAHGFFKDEGLDATVHWTESGSDIVPLMTARAIALATGGANSQVTLTGLKAPVKTIAALSNSAGTQGLVLAPGVKLSNPRQLEGKRLASPLVSPHIMMLAKLAQEYGFDVKKVKLVYMEPSDAVVAVSKSEVDGALTYDPFMYTLVKNLGATLYVTGTTSYVTGTKRVLPADDQLLYQHSVFFVDQSWIDEKPNTLKAVLRALLRADAMIHNNRAQAVAIMASQLHLGQDELADIMNANTYGLAIDAALARSITFASQWLQTVHRLSFPVTPAMALEPKLLRQIDPRLVTWKA